MKICIVGRGWVGKKMFANLLLRNHIVDNISHTDLIYHKYDWIINCAGYTGYPNVDDCEFKTSETIEANTVFPIRLFDYCSSHGIRYAHFSSGCIYSGLIESVDAKPNYYGSVYSMSKACSDLYLRNKCVIFRIRMPFTQYHEPKNLFSKLLWYSKHSKLYDGGFNSLTDLDEAINVACNIIENNPNNECFNLVNPGYVNMTQIASLLKLKTKWFTEQEFRKSTKASRSNCIIPSNTNMRSINIALSDRANFFCASSPKNSSCDVDNDDTQGTIESNTGE